jgi:hypothetical protein
MFTRLRLLLRTDGSDRFGFIIHEDARAASVMATSEIQLPERILGASNEAGMGIDELAQVPGHFLEASARKPATSQAAGAMTEPPIRGLRSASPTNLMTPARRWDRGVRDRGSATNDCHY